MGYNPEKYKISVDQVEVDTSFVIPLKVYRVTMSSKEKMRIIRFKINQSDIDNLVKQYDGKLGTAEAL
jgi:Holliday junction resolvase RusA-like endonuclease